VGFGESWAGRGRNEGRKEEGAGELYMKMSLIICTAGETEIV
jgi:hypothetical protein